MMECGQKAILIVTTTPAGTATNVARTRIELTCGLSQGHPGAHRDQANGEDWIAAPGEVHMVLRHEDEHPG